ncbi:MAG TPA: M1 family metallopeptidase, partial [Chitinophagaceae bacterium]|nr:M1 family metallopeptidase [Chitinophagaceae bacterium]
MKKHFLSFALFMMTCSLLFAQQPGSAPVKTSWDDLPGTYQVQADSTMLFRVKKRNNRLVLEVVGQGETELSPLPDNRFRPKHVEPATTVEFIRDSLGRIQKLTWLQDQQVELYHVPPASGEEGPGGYTGRYKLKNNPYLVIKIKEEKNGLTVQQNEGSKIQASPLAGNRFIYQRGDFSLLYEFTKDDKGQVQKLLLTKKGPMDCIKIPDAPAPAHVMARDFYQREKFTRADTLRGMLTPLRSCYDVLFYGLDITVLPETKSIRGTSLLRFRAMHAFDKMQVDLFANMNIEKILFHGQPLSYTREYNAVFIQLPELIGQGKEDALTFFYSGKPQEPSPQKLWGGFIWAQDETGQPWIESVCQGSGASLWWPCKDHLSDKPDSMKISITVPRGLTDISNGRLLQKTDLPGNLTRFDWYVSYPINNYNVVVNIGNYAHFSDLYIDRQDTLTLDYYAMPYNLEKARQLFKNVGPMLTRYEKFFGKYPFKRDGFTVLESLYPMEHQSAVSIGPINSNAYDSTELTRLLWHESAHEWWGNSVTCNDMADFWLHEAFATYAEFLNYEAVSCKAASAYLKDQHPANKTPITGFYNVNDFYLGDMYSKGCLMLNTLRHVINNDSLWFNVLKGIQQRFRYRSVTAEDITRYINEATKTDYTYFFDQYLRHPAVPELVLAFEKKGDRS